MELKEREKLPERRERRDWVQTQRRTHEAWAELIGKSPLAARIMHLLVSRLGKHNAVVISQSTLASLTGATKRGVQKAVAVLESGRWVEIRQIGATSSVNAYVVNDRVGWMRARDDLRYSLFSATVVVSEEEQPDRAEIEQQEPLLQLPMLGEGQLPTGDGLPPPSQPSIPGMEPDLPARRIDLDPDQLDIEDFTALRGT